MEVEMKGASTIIPNQAVKRLHVDNGVHGVHGVKRVHGVKGRVTATETPLCFQNRCQFYGDKTGYCSHHRVTIPPLMELCKAMRQKTPHLHIPAHLMIHIAEFARPTKGIHDFKIPLPDAAIAEVMIRHGMANTEDDIFLPRILTDEWVYRLQHGQRLPEIYDCTNHSSVRRMACNLGLEEVESIRKVFRVDDATRLMSAIIASRASSLTVLAAEKVLVLRTLNNEALSEELFRVGKCYMGNSMLISKSLSETSIVHAIERRYGSRYFLPS